MNQEQKKRDSEQLIAQYLSSHPDFFERHLDILEKLRIPHPVQPAVSLLERQVRHLREQNSKLRRRLQELIRVARDNDCLSKRMQNMNLALIDARELGDMMRSIQSVLRDEFNADFTALRLYTPIPQVDLDELNRFDPASLELFKPLMRGARPVCGQLDQELIAALFDDAAEQVQSVAVVPLNGDNWQGVLAIGSRDKERFAAGMGTLFLSRLGELLLGTLQIPGLKRRHARGVGLGRSRVHLRSIGGRLTAGRRVRHGVLLPAWAVHRTGTARGGRVHLGSFGNLRRRLPTARRERKPQRGNESERERLVESHSHRLHHCASTGSGCGVPFGSGVVI